MAFTSGDAVTSARFGGGTVVLVADGSDEHMLYPDGYPVAASFSGAAFVLSFKEDGSAVLFSGWYNQDGESFDEYFVTFGEPAVARDVISAA